jgi:platelet-activating factor acetylhydrolase IB subunit alpha
MKLKKKDEEEINKAILEYLHFNYEKSHQTFAEEANMDPTEGMESKQSQLVLKWRSIGKLQRRINELEDKIKIYMEQNDPTQFLKGQREGLPREPETNTLLGHQQRVTSVTFHPIYDILASASEDASIRLWDSEMGE